MIQVDLNATVRDRFGKGAARSMRREGRTPAVLYGPKAAAVALDLETKGFTQTLLKLQRQNAVVNLTILDKDGKGETRQTMIKEIQTDPVQDFLVHADFLEIPMDTPMTLKVPVKLTGKAKGAEVGGEVVANLPTVLMQGKVLDLPDFLEVDVSPLEVGDSITCKDLSIPADVSLLEDDDTVFVSLSMPSLMPDEDEEEGAAEAVKEGAEEEKAEESAAS